MNRENPIKSIKIADPGYPNSLKSTSPPPPTLYYIGALPGNCVHISVVGSRKMSDYGKQVLAKIINDLAGYGVCIVSGLAFGVDAEAHRLAIANGLKTIAVLGSAIDNIQPNINRPLAQQIINSGGAIVSEYGPGAAIYKSNFPARNRIIAGLSAATVVIEANAKSGALITARFADKYKRQVYAVPGSIFHDLSAGTNHLLKEFARPITTAGDLKDLLPKTSRKAFPTATGGNLAGLSESEQIVYKLIGFAPIVFDEICAKAKLPVQQVNSILSMLEIKNKIRKTQSNSYCRNLTAQ